MNTPRTNERFNQCMYSDFETCEAELKAFAEFAKKLERELWAANEVIKQCKPCSAVIERVKEWA